MVKSKVIKESESNFIRAGTKDKTAYLRIPLELVNDSMFPFKYEIQTRMSHSVKIKMLKDKLIVEAA